MSQERKQRVAIDNWNRLGLKPGKRIQVIDPKNPEKKFPLVRIVVSQHFKSGLAFDLNGKLFSSPSPLVRYLLQGRRISNGWKYLK